jgi:putative nucleotidyltransferase with HDIG domain
MLGVQKAKTGDWVLFLARVPGQEPQPAGILLVDSVEDQLHVRLQDDFESSDSGMLEVWRELAADLQQMAQIMGGTGVLNWFEENASHTFTISSRHQIIMQSTESTLDHLFQSHVAAKLPKSSKVVAVSPPVPKFTDNDLAAARHKLPNSPRNALQVIATLRNPNVNFSRVEECISQDPTLAAHLIKLANSPLFYAGGEIRTVTRAILHVGLDRAVRHLSALVLRKLFASPGLQKVWNHSVTAAQINSQLSKLCNYSDPDELLLLGLVHDIGQIVSYSLGETFHRAYHQLLKQGHYPVEIERKLFGKSHAEIGADLLAFWSFPKDMTEAVRYHHGPSPSNLRLTSFLYVTESWLESDEDIFNPAEHQSALQLLNLSNSDLSGLTKQLDPEMAMLQFAA